MEESKKLSTDITAVVEKSSAAAMEKIERTLEHFFETASVKSVYDRPVRHGETLIIPAAEVLGVLGFGMGAGLGMGESPDKRDDTEEGDAAELEKPDKSEKVEGSGGGGGGGGGGRVFARPVAVIVSGPEGVRVEPVLDRTKIGLAFITALGFMFSMASRMRRPPSSEE